MALVVSTTPPEVVVQAKPKLKEDDKKHGTAILCDSFWACVLNDYIDDETELEAFDSQNDVVGSDDIANAKERKKEKKRRRREKKRRIIMAIESIAPEQEPQEREHLVDEDFMGMELDNLLSDDLDDTELRDSSVPESQEEDGTRDVEPERKEKVVSVQLDVGPEEQLTRDLEKKELPSDQHFDGTDELEAVEEVEEEPHDEQQSQEAENQSHAEDRDHAQADVIHYAPLSYEAAKKRAQEQIDTVRQSASPPRRIPVDPEEGTVHRSHQELNMRTSNEPQLSPFGLLQKEGPRDPSTSSRLTAQQSRSLNSASTRDKLKRNRNAERRRTARAETIDLASTQLTQRAMQLLKVAEKQTRADDTAMLPPTPETPLGQVLLESRRAEDYRRRKLDRKEALNRIRAIKARLQTVDP